MASLAGAFWAGRFDRMVATTRLREGKDRFMEHLLMRYRIKPEQLERHLELLRAVYEEIHAQDPGGLTFISYQLEDPHEFVELAAAPELPGPLPSLESFQRYRSGLEARCESRTTEFLHPTASYGFPTPDQ